MKQIAEDDYKYSIDQALKSNNTAFSTWAQNIKNNDYSVIDFQFKNCSLLALICIFFIAFDVNNNKRLLEKSDRGRNKREKIKKIE